jgi:hypothetical protein
MIAAVDAGIAKEMPALCCEMELESEGVTVMLQDDRGTQVRLKLSDTCPQ